MKPHEPPSPTRRRVLAALAAAAVAPMTAARADHVQLIVRAIPKSGERLPVIGVGTWQTFDVGPKAPERAELKEVLRRMVDAGASVIDSSPMYGQSERVAGELAAELALRQRLFLATKVWTQGRDEGIRQMEESFRLLRTERMDLMQVHNLVDVATHARTLREWKQAGRVRYTGVTHYHAGAYRDLERELKAGDWDFVQLNYSLAEREAESRLLPLAQELNVAVLVNRPFAGAALFSRVQGKPLPPWAAELECRSWAQFFLKWIVSHPAVTCAIPGTRRVTHLLDNLHGGSGRLPDATMRARMAKYLDSL